MLLQQIMWVLVGVFLGCALTIIMTVVTNVAEPREKCGVACPDYFRGGRGKRHCGQGYWSEREDSFNRRPNLDARGRVYKPLECPKV